MFINAKEELKKQVLISFGIDKYIWLRDNLHTVDLSLAKGQKGYNTTKEYQQKFNGYYGVRRNDAWRERYYCFFQKSKNIYRSLSFDIVIEGLYECLPTHSVEPSFSSKMLAMINTSMPIWDRRVLASLGLDDVWNKQEHTISNAKKIYEEICEFYERYLHTDECVENLKLFNSILKPGQIISDSKKIDFLLWSRGNDL